MADVLTWFLIIIGSWLVLNCYWLASVALFPSLVAECRERYRLRPVAATLLGVAILVPLAVFAIAATKAAPHPLVGALIAGVMLLPALLALLGSAGLAQRIGAGLASPADAQQPWRRVARGGAVLGFTFLLPFLGWFMVLPWTLVSGFGAAVMALWRRAFPHAVVAAPGEAGDSPTVVTALPGGVR